MSLETGEQCVLTFDHSCEVEHIFEDTTPLRPDAAPPKEIQMCGDPCTREANHEGGCFAPITADTCPHPSDCHCEWCGGPTARQIAEIICPGYAHNLRRLMTDDERSAGKACGRCHVWALGIRDALNRLKGETDG